MSNEAYEPGMLTTNLKETLNNLDLKRLLKEKLDDCDSKTDLILEQLDYTYRPITEPISVNKSEIYINANFKPRIDYHRNNSKNGETKYWKNNNNYHHYKDDKNYNEKNEPVDNYDEEDDEDLKSNKKLKSIVVQQVISTCKF